MADLVARVAWARAAADLVLDGGVTGVDGALALQVGDQAEEQRQSQEQASHGIREPVPAEVNHAVADKENDQYEDGAESRAITTEEIPAFGQIEDQTIDNGRPQHVAAG